MKATVLFVGCVALFAAVGAKAQTKIAITLTCKSDADHSHSVEVGDRPGHVLSLWKAACTYAQPAEIGGEKVKEGYAVALSEDTETRGTDNGHNVATMENGDKAFQAFRGTTPRKDGKPAGDTTGVWSYTGGTGLLKGIKGKGTYKATQNKDGTATVVVEGSYELPAAKAK